MFSAWHSLDNKCLGINYDEACGEEPLAQKNILYVH